MYVEGQPATLAALQIIGADAADLAGRRERHVLESSHATHSFSLELDSEHPLRGENKMADDDDDDVESNRRL